MKCPLNQLSGTMPTGAVRLLTQLRSNQTWSLDWSATGAWFTVHWGYDSLPPVNRPTSPTLQKG